MLKRDRSSLDYFTLIKDHHAPELPGPVLKVALLADVSTQHLAPLLKTLFAHNGINASLYEGDYAAIELEAHNLSLGRYRCHPDWVCAKDKAPPAERWEPRIDTREGLKATAAWYRENRWL